MDSCKKGNNGLTNSCLLDSLIYLYVLMLPVFRLNVTSTVARSNRHLLALGSNGPTTDTETVLLPANHRFIRINRFIILIYISQLIIVLFKDRNN